MSQLSPEARRLVQLARHEDDPEPSAQNRVERSLARRIAVGAGVVTTTAAAAKSAAGAAATATVAKIVAIASVSAVAAGGGWLAYDSLRPAAAPSVAVPTGASSGALPEGSDSPSSPTLPAASEPSVGASVQPERLSERAPITKERRSGVTSRSPRSRGAGSEPQTPDQLRAETRALRTAQQALRGGDPARALELLRQQDASHAHGLLAEERAAARVLALCQSGQVEQARAEARRFEQHWPRSPLVARVRSSCSSP